MANYINSAVQSLHGPLAECVYVHFLGTLPLTFQFILVLQIFRLAAQPEPEAIASWTKLFIQQQSDPTFYASSNHHKHSKWTPGPENGFPTANTLTSHE